jgi:hypothetical protein
VSEKEMKRKLNHESEESEEWLESRFLTMEGTGIDGFEEVD